MAIESKTGPDMIQLVHNWHTSTRGDWQPSTTWPRNWARRGEGYFDMPKAHCAVGAQWRAIPHSVICPAAHLPIGSRRSATISS